MNIRYFNITNRVEKEEVEIMWVPREDMVADYLTKALQGAEFCRFRDLNHGECLRVIGQSFTMVIGTPLNQSRSVLGF